jgi:hypothetical protein
VERGHDTAEREQGERREEAHAAGRPCPKHERAAYASAARRSTASAATQLGRKLVMPSAGANSHAPT